MNKDPMENNINFAVSIMMAIGGFVVTLVILGLLFESTGHWVIVAASIIAAVCAVAPWIWGKPVQDDE